MKIVRRPRIKLSKKPESPFKRNALFGIFSMFSLYFLVASSFTEENSPDTTQGANDASSTSSSKIIDAVMRMLFMGAMTVAARLPFFARAQSSSLSLSSSMPAVTALTFANSLLVRAEEASFFSAYDAVAHFESLYADALVQTSDSLIVVGRQNTASPYNAYISRWYLNGTLAWMQRFTNQEDLYLNAVAATTDESQYLVTGSTIGASTGQDVFAALFDNDGTLVFARNYAGSAVEYGTGLKRTSDNGFLLTGTTSSAGGQGSNVFALKLNSDFSNAWMTVGSTSANDEGLSSNEFSSGNAKYVITGTTGGFPLFFFVDSYGNSVDSRSFDAPASANVVLLGGAKVTVDQGLVLVGYYTNAQGLNTPYISRWDNNKNVEWAKALALTTSSTYNDVELTDDGGFVTVGNLILIQGGPSGIFVSKWNGAGAHLWSLVISNDGNENAYSVRQIPGAGFVVSGYATSPAAGYLIMIDADGSIQQCSSNVVTNITSIANEAVISYNRLSQTMQNLGSSPALIYPVFASSDITTAIILSKISPTINVICKYTVPTVAPSGSSPPLAEIVAPTVLGVALLAATAGGVFYLRKKHKKKENENIQLAPPAYDQAIEINLGVPPEVKRYSENICRIDEAAEFDYKKVLELYQLNPVPGYEIDKVLRIKNFRLESGFEEHARKLQLRKESAVLEPDQWKYLPEDKENKEWRRRTHDFFVGISEKGSDEYPSVNFTFLWHGTDANGFESIQKTGYVDLKKTDDGFYAPSGSVYGTLDAEYAYRVYAHADLDNGILLINKVASFSILPIIKGDTKDIINSTIYDARFVFVSPRDPNSKNEANYDPCDKKKLPTYTEMAVQQDACLPYYRVKLRQKLPKNVETVPADLAYQVAERFERDNKPLVAFYYYSKAKKLGSPQAEKQLTKLLDTSPSFKKYFGNLK